MESSYDRRILSPYKKQNMVLSVSTRWEKSNWMQVDFKVKENSIGTIKKYKARLIAKGFHQVASFDFNETFGLVVKLTTIRVVLTIALVSNWVVKHLDINNAFLNGDL